ncbi:GIN domain-containing protein [Mucilaginibacter sp. PPCGB 2223]|uniref:GIN domain-containing protein n=1 Tax=Mucilaginibacter sp. PPCGB 2223 TaxID=1886027 RepID=UPI001112BC24|nr:DUF2807 domain-containing protein [Mucilaginibacter sp. PPCGB 2223]
MKTISLSIATVLLFILSLGNTAKAAVKNSNIATVLSEVNNFTNIEVNGNVELYVSTGEANKVKVYDSYYNQNALVQEQNGTLRISSYKAEKLVVWVTVADLRSISATDNAVIKSFGKLSSIDFKLNLKDKATAQLDLDASSASVVLNGNAKAKLSGFAGESVITADPSAHLNMAKLTSGKSTVEKPVEIAAVAQTDDLIVLE